MNFWRLLIVLGILIIGFGNIWGQELTAEEKKAFEQRYFNDTALINAVNLMKVNKMEEAQAILPAIIEKFEKNKQWHAFCIANNKLIGTYAARGNFEQALTISDDCLKKLSALSPTEKYWGYIINGIRGDIFQRKNQPLKAIDAYSKKITALTNSSIKIDSVGIANMYGKIGTVYYGMDKMENAHENFSKALNIYLTLKQNKEVLTGISICHTNMGNIFGRKGEMQKGIDYLKKGLEIMRKLYGDDHPRLIRYYNLIGSFYNEIGENQLAKNYYSKNLFILQNANLQDTPKGKSQLIRIYYNLGHIENLLLNYTKAMEYYQYVVSFAQELKKVDFEIIGLVSIGDLYTNLKKYEAGLSNLEKADSLYREVEKQEIRIPRMDRIKTVLISNFADYYIATKQPENVIKYYKPEFIRLSQPELKATSNIDRATIAFKLADQYLDLENNDSAFYYNQQAIQAVSKSFDSTDYYELPDVHDLIKVNIVYEVLIQKANIFKATANDSAYNQLISTVNLLDAVHTENLKSINFLRGSESTGLITLASEGYKQALLLTEQALLVRDPSLVASKLFYLTQKLKSQQLMLTLLKSEAVQYSDLNADFFEQEKQILLNITKIEDQIFDAQKHQDTLLIASLKNKTLFNANLEYESLLQKIEKENTSYYQLKYNFIPETAESLKNILIEGELIIEYVFSDSILFAFTISKNQPLSIQKIFLKEQTNQRIKTYKSILTNSTMSRPSSREKFINLSHQLYQQFLQPIEDQIKDKKRLIIIGDGITNYIPFETLLATNEVKPFKDLDFLIKKHEISYHYSSTLFAKAKRKEITKNEGVFAFAPVYDNGTSTTASSLRNNVDVMSIDSTLRAYTPDGYFAPLPESENETKSIVRLFEKQNTNATLALRENATEKNLKTNLEQPYRFLHIAGHSFADLDNPKFSGIACFQEENTDSISTNDGTLFTGEIYNISSKADLVTLSSCESGLGKLEKTEGLLGLNRAFIYAGTPNVIFSLWKVYDKVSANLMVDFYENVLEGKDYSESLWEAKLKLLDNEATAAPHFWSPFLLIGR